MKTGFPLARELVLIGGGHTHALLLRKWGMDKLAGVRLTLINPDVTAPYTGMLPGYVAGHYQRNELDIDLVSLARHAGARLVQDHVINVDTNRKRIILRNRPEIAYDIASINVGITSSLPVLEGFTDYGHSAKPLGPFARAWDEFVKAVILGKQQPQVAVIGAGVAGAELALALAYRLKNTGTQELATQPSVTLLEASQYDLSELSPAAQRAIRAALARYQVQIRTKAEVTSVDKAGVHLADGDYIAAEFVVSAAGAKGHSWLSETGLALHEGYIVVDKNLRSTSDSSIYAVGDCAHLSHAPRPKAGVFAVREAPVLYHNLRAVLTGGQQRSYQPQRDYLKLISTGARFAVADKFGLALKGKWLWRVKDRIDQRFMDQFRHLPNMAALASVPSSLVGLDDAAGAEAPLCGGCGSKVARAELRAGLQSVSPPSREDVLSKLGDDAAILRCGESMQVITTDHLRAFVEDPWTLARIAVIHAMGDVWAMGGSPQTVLAALIIPQMTPVMQSNMVREIMAGVDSIVANTSADVVGGHTSMGAELTIGFTVTGLVEGTPIELSGAASGDCLILTKPIGTGVILAAEMRSIARGCDVEAALASMSRPLAAAAEILAPHATAMTDVTGFGLAGHLLQILEESNVGAEIELAAIPLLAGAEVLAESGVKSTLWPGNAEMARQVSYANSLHPHSARSELLFDPQTAGGLLAAVPAGSAADVLTALKAVGETAAMIGVLIEGEPHILVR